MCLLKIFDIALGRIVHIESTRLVIPDSLHRKECMHWFKRWLRGWEHCIIKFDQLFFVVINVLNWFWMCMDVGMEKIKLQSIPKVWQYKMFIWFQVFLTTHILWKFDQIYQPCFPLNQLSTTFHQKYQLQNFTISNVHILP